MSLIRLHPNARTTPRTRKEIQESSEPVAVLAARYNTSETTIRSWQNRTDQHDRSHRPHRLNQSTSPLVEALIVELRQHARLSIDDITEVLTRFGARVSRDAVYRAMKRLGVAGRLPPLQDIDAPKPFEPTEPGFVHIDLKHLRKLKGRADFAFVAIERTTRFVHLEVLPDRKADTVAAALQRFLDAAPFAVHTILTDNGAEFTDRFARGPRNADSHPTGTHPVDRVCAAAGIEHRLTRPYTPQTNGMVERFNRRLAEALRALPAARDNARRGTKFETHDDRARFLDTFVKGYNQTRLRCLNYKTPIQAVNNLPQHNR